MNKGTDRDIGAVLVSGLQSIAGKINSICINLFRAQFITQPVSSINAVVGDTITISVGAVNVVAYQWYKKKFSDSSWTKITGAVTDELTFTADETGNTSYRCEIQGKDNFMIMSNSCTVIISEQGG